MGNNENRPLAEIVAERLTNFIIDNNLQSGDKIPNEFELVERLNVSRSTIREAVKLLCSRNILEIRRGAGTFVSEKKGISNDPLGLAFVDCDKFELAKDLLEVRMILEPEIAYMAAVNATDEEIKVIINQCNIVEELYMNDKPHMNEDIKFHEAIARCSRNVVIEKLIPIINTSVAVFADITARQLKDETIITHREVAQAIAKHDGATAKYAMTMHLIYNRRKIMELLEEHNEK